jgi:hypothetical protein
MAYRLPLTPGRFLNPSVDDDITAKRREGNQIRPAALDEVFA